MNYSIHLLSMQWIKHMMILFLGVKFQHKFTDYIFIVISCYLPPENSPWSNNTNFLSHLISQLYIYEDVDNIFIAGDFSWKITRWH